MNNFDSSIIINACIGIGAFTFFLAVIILIIKSIFNTNKTNTLINEQIDTTKNNDSFTNVTTTKQFKKTVYENGQKISEEETITHNNITPITNCPNCGATIKNKTKTNCDYCHTKLY